MSHEEGNGRGKLAELLVAKRCPNIIFLQETNLNEDNIHKLKMELGWHVAYNPTPVGYMKGSAILIHCSLMPIRNDLHVVLNFSDIDLDIIAVKAEGILFISIYLHATSAVTSPKLEMHDKLMQKLMEIDDFNKPNQPMIIGGDFNYPELQSSLKNYMQAVGLNQACDDRPTYKRLERDVVIYESKLDWIFCKNVHTCDYQVDVQDTDHDILRLSFKIPKEGRSNALKYNYRKWRKMDAHKRGAFNQALENAATEAIDISDFYQKLQDLTLHFLGPQTSCRPKAPPLFMKQEVRQAKKKYKRLLKLYRADASDENKAALQEAKTNLRKLLKRHTKKERRKKGQLVDLGLGDIIKDFVHSKDSLHHQKRLLENPTAMVEFWKRVFYDEDALHDHIDQILAGNGDDDNPDAGTWKRSGDTMKITAEEVELAIAELKNKTPADDDLRLPLLQSCSHKTLEQLARLYNAMGQSMKIPLWMKGGIGRVIHKSGPKSDPSNYRIILLAPLLGKIYDKILEIKLRELQEHEFLTIWKEQYGFLKDRQTYDPVFIVNSIRDGQKRKRAYMILAFMDLKKAFDSVNHLKLLHALKHQGAPDSFLNMLAPLLDCRYMELCGEKVVFMKGTPQGSPISPLLFLFFINPLLKRLSDECEGLPFTEKLYYTCLAFADDLALIPQDNRELAKMLKICKEWANQFGMSFNISKSKLMVCEGSPLNTDLSIEQLPMEMELVNEFKYLGVLLYGKPTAGRRR
jgi:exonuclease III